MAEVAALRAKNQYQKQKRARRKGNIRESGSMTVQDGQDSIQRRVVKKQLEDNAKNIDPALLTEQPTSRRMKAPSKYSRYGSFDHNAKRCIL